MNIRKIEEVDFRKLDGVRQVLVNEYPQQFGLLDLGQLGCYGLAWGSEHINPIVKTSEDDQKLWVGVDQRLAVIDLQGGYLHLSLPLAGNVCQILITEGITAVLTELEVILFNNDCSIRCICVLSDLSESISFSDPEFTIRLFDGTDLTLNSQTGVLVSSNTKPQRLATQLAESIQHRN